MSSATFDPSPITNVRLTPGQPDLVIQWDSTLAAGQTHQVYLGGRLVWSGPGTRCEIPTPSGAGSHPITIGVAPVTQARRNLLATQPSPALPDTATLVWLGGAYLAPGLAGFRVYQGTGPGLPVGTKAVATIAAYPGGIWQDGYGQGGYGQGGYGSAASTYRWTSGHLEPGTWNFAVAPVDATGLVGPLTPFVVVIQGPPRAPRGLTATLDPTSGMVTLAWLASPSAASP